MIAAGTESHFSLKVWSKVDCDHHSKKAIHPRIKCVRQIILHGFKKTGRRGTKLMGREGDGSERSEPAVNMIKTHCVKLLGTKEKEHSKIQ